LSLWFGLEEEGGEEEEEEESKRRRGRSHRVVWAARETAIDIFLDYFTLPSLVRSVAGLGWAGLRGVVGV
jgi:hypothetical protein